MKKKQKKVSVGSKIAVGTGALAAGAALYMLFGPNGKKNRGRAKNWAIAMEKEIVKKLNEAKDLSEPAYHEIIDRAKAKYEKIKSIDKKELASVLADLRKHWIVMTKQKTTRKSARGTKAKTGGSGRKK